MHCTRPVTVPHPELCGTALFGAEGAVSAVGTRRLCGKELLPDLSFVRLFLSLQHRAALVFLTLLYLTLLVALVRSSVDTRYFLVPYFCL